jgi:membrane protease YdiL (CAAX protease family)
LLKASSLRSRHLNQSSSRPHFSSRSKVNDLRVRKVKTSHRTLLSSRNSEKSTIEPEITSPSSSELPFDGRYAFEILFYQSLIIVVSVAAAIFLNTPNFGLGENICLDVASVKFGAIAVVPLILLAIGLDLIEKYVPALQDVTTATQRSVLNLFGSNWKPFTALLVALAAGIVAGIGEEMLFRGIIQTWLSARWGVFMSISLSSLVFGALHAVTPMYAALTFIGSLYFGALYHVSPGNLVVPIVCHALYDVVVLMWAHFVVTSMTIEEQQKILNKTNTA